MSHIIDELKGIERLDPRPFGAKGGDFTVLSRYCVEITSCVGRIAENVCKIGFCLYRIRMDVLYKGYPKSDDPLNGCYWSFEEFVNGIFGMSKMTAYRYMDIYEAFGDSIAGRDAKGILREPYKDYSVTALSLMAPYELDKQYGLIGSCTSDMSVARIKEILSASKKTPKEDTVDYSEECSNAVVVDFVQDHEDIIDPPVIIEKHWDLSNRSKRLSFIEDYESWGLYDESSVMHIKIYTIDVTDKLSLYACVVEDNCKVIPVCKDPICGWICDKFSFNTYISVNQIVDYLTSEGIKEVVKK